MTREEAIKIFNTVLFFGKCDCSKEEVEECFKMAIKALEQKPTTKIEESNFSQEQYLADMQSAYDCGKSILGKIRAEISALQSHHINDCYDDGFQGCRTSVLEIIDKYKTESEEKE